MRTAGGDNAGDGESIDFLPSESIFWQRCSVLIPIKALLCPLPSSESEEEEREYFDTLPWSASKEIGYSIYLPHEREQYILPTSSLAIVSQELSKYWKYWPESGLIGRQLQKVSTGRVLYPEGWQQKAGNWKWGRHEGEDSSESN